MPLRKSKTRASTMTAIIRSDMDSSHSGSLDHDVGDHIGSFVPAIGGVAQMAIDLAQFQREHHMLDIRRALEKLSQRLAIDILHAVLQGFRALGMVAGYIGVRL